MQVRRDIPADDPMGAAARITPPGSRSAITGPGPVLAVRRLCALALALALVGCGGDGETTEAAVSEGNAERIRAEYARVDPVRAAAFDTRSATASASEQGAPTAPATALVSATANATATGALAGARPADTATVDPASPGQGGGAPATGAASADDGSTAGRFAVDALAAINAARAQARTCGETDYPPVAPVRWNERAAFAALLEVEWMQRDNAFGHEWPTGEHVWHRLAMAGYDWTRADENIAAGFRTLEAAMAAWIDSPSHCKALMRPDVVEVGVAVIPGKPDNTYLSYWAMVLAAPR